MLLLPAVGLALSLAAPQGAASDRAGGNRATSAESSKAQTPSQTQGRSDLSSQDLEFIDKAGIGGEYGMALARLAANKAKSAKARTFADMMTTENYAMNAELAAIGHRLGFAVEPKLDSQRTARLAELSRMSGDEFDREWISTAIHEHENTLKAFKKEADEGGNHDLEQFASRIVPILESHIKAAKAVKEAAGG